MAATAHVVRRLALLGAAAMAACAEPEPEPMVRLIVGSEAAVPAIVDEVLVEITASRTAAGATCIPSSRSFHLRGPDDLPLRVAYVPGRTYASWVAFRVTWMRAGATVAIRELLEPLGAPGVVELPVALESACLRAACGTDVQCARGVCTPFPTPDPFDPRLIDSGVRCNSTGE